MEKLQKVDDCAAVIAEIGEVERKIDGLQADLDHEVAQLKKAVEEEAQPLEDRRAALAARVEDFCKRNRKSLTNGGKSQSATFTTGEAGWRKGRPRVDLDPRRAGEIIAGLQAKPSMARFLNVKTTLDQRAVLKEPEKFDGIEGLTFVKAKETFWVKPLALELAGKQPVDAAR